ncbi:MAG TPA: dTMP kinase [Flexilinea sp.]|jgi:dTMP kinase|nr:MAG: Thymidylate kinase [Chloroflexi bacterium ADurb.Bin344]HOG21820.1 dTMP kinase [Flexilinea sp.]HOP01199.1 dTMP kinase [Flexilinea sp.]HOR55684.1 dTMP kinase [Flexilinea sp.]HOU19354.1 dTMP kinase [Flexilinea sp.]
MFITFEGPDGSGKTTQVKRIGRKLIEKGFDIVYTREPGGTEISDQVREILMNMKNKQMCPRTEILLFCAARAQLVEEVIRPALQSGKIVISDRYADSTLAYQGYGHGFEQETLKQLLNFATGNLWPDLTFLLDIPAEKGLRRRINNQEEWNRMDDYQLAFHERVRNGYHQLAAADPQRWEIIDADQSEEAVENEIMQRLARRLHF